MSDTEGRPGERPEETEPPDDEGPGALPPESAEPSEAKQLPSPPSSGELGAQRRRERAKPIDEADIGTVHWFEGVAGQVLAVLLRGRPVGADRVEVGPAGSFLTRMDNLTRLIAAAFTRDTPRPIGPIAQATGLGNRLQFVGARGGSSITLYFAAPPRPQLTMEGDERFDSAIGRAVLHLVELVDLSDEEQRLLTTLHELGDRIADRYFELVDFLVKEQLEVGWLPVGRQGVLLPREGAAEVKAVLDREVAEQVERSN